MKCYDVALWQYSLSLWPEWMEVVVTLSSRLAIYEVMQRHGLRYVEKAAVVEVVERAGSPGSPIQCWRRVAPIERWYSVTCLEQEEVMAND